MEPKTMTRKEAAQALRISERTLDRYISEGQLKPYRVGRNGRRIILLAEDVMRLLQPATR
jgi:excisionase family DNA binding protein